MEARGTYRTSDGRGELLRRWRTDHRLAQFHYLQNRAAGENRRRGEQVDRDVDT